MRLSKKQIYRRRFKKVILIFFLFLIFYLFLIKAKEIIIKSGIFTLRKVYANASLEDLVFLKNKFLGKSIFLADLSYMARYISAHHPEFEKVKVKRRFPDRVIIEIVPKKPYAQCKIGSFYYLIDREGVIISQPHSLPYGDGIIIYAGYKRPEEIKIGKRLNLDNFKPIKELIDYLKADKFFSRHSVESIHGYTLNDIWFDLDGIKVKIGNSDYRRRLRILKQIIIPRFRTDWQKISYIDLRFKDPVVGYRR